MFREEDRLRRKAALVLSYVKLLDIGLKFEFQNIWWNEKFTIKKKTEKLQVTIR